jgi:hypothetical protein
MFVGMTWKHIKPGAECQRSLGQLTPVRAVPPVTLCKRGYNLLFGMGVKTSEDRNCPRIASDEISTFLIPAANWGMAQT